MTHRFRPRLWTSVATLPVLAILLGLGFWQLERLEWKNNLVADMQARMTAPAMPLPNSFAEAESLRFSRVKLSGRFLHDRELYRRAQPLKNTRGAFVITPLRLEDGREILVNRGWVPLEKLDPATRPETLVKGQVAFDAIVREGGWDGASWLRPANDPAGNVWLWMDLARMARAARLDNPITAIYVDTVKNATPGRYPIGGQTRVNLRNDHLNYALTWFGLALVLVVIYVLFHLHPVKRGGRET